jgi:predicted nucleotidyltransferase
MQKQLPSSLESIFPILLNFKNSAADIYGSRLKKIILYGSYARGMARKDSDIDLMIVLSEMDSAFAEIERLNEIKYDLGLEYEVFISSNPVSEEIFTHSTLPIYKNVAREGIEI